MQEFAEQVEIALNGKVVSQTVDGQQRTDVWVGIDVEARGNLDAIRSLPIATPAGAIVPLADLAEVAYGKGANVVNREDVSCLIVVSANVSGRDLGSVVGDINRSVERSIRLPSGYSIRYGGQFESEERATASLVL